MAKKKKRCATGYNLFIKDCYQKGGVKGKESFSKCLTDKGWGKLSDKEKNEWNTEAKELCDV